MVFPHTCGRNKFGGYPLQHEAHPMNHAASIAVQVAPGRPRSPCCHAAMLPCCHAAMLPCCHAARSPCCQVARSPCIMRHETWGSVSPISQSMTHGAWGISQTNPGETQHQSPAVIGKTLCKQRRPGKPGIFATRSGVERFHFWYVPYDIHPSQ